MRWELKPNRPAKQILNSQPPTPAPDPDPNLEAWITERLKTLPSLTAPSTLVPHVLEKLQARLRQPWWLRVWWDWPLAARVASILLGFALVGVIGGGSLVLDQQVSSYTNEVTERFTPLAGLWDVATSLGRALIHVWTIVAEPVVLATLMIGGVLYLLCLGIGTAIFRSVLRRI